MSDPEWLAMVKTRETRMEEYLNDHGYSEYELEDLVVVLLGIDGKVLAQHKTKVGIDS